jgi:hypothetical protein
VSSLWEYCSGKYHSGCLGDYILQFLPKEATSLILNSSNQGDDRLDISGILADHGRVLAKHSNRVVYGLDRV